MKTTLRLSLAVALAALIACGVLTANAGPFAGTWPQRGHVAFPNHRADGHQQREHKTVRTIFDTTVPAADPVYDSAGNPAVAGHTPLYSNSSGLCDHLFPLTAPDGHHITLREWQRAKGTALMKCGPKGTHVVLHLSGLIPNGVYTVWVATFQAPGLTPDFANLIGLGALGAPDGSENVVLASPHGTAQLSVFHPPGDFSIFGSTDCLSDEFEVLLWLPLHLDGQTSGPVPGDECALGFQGAFSFKQ